MVLRVRSGPARGIVPPYKRGLFKASLQEAKDTTRSGERGTERRKALDDFYYGEGGLRCEEVALSEIARSVGTPTYVYSYGALEKAYRELDEAFAGLDHMVCYAVKANGNLAVLRAGLFGSRGGCRLRR